MCVAWQCMVWNAMWHGMLWHAVWYATWHAIVCYVGWHREICYVEWWGMLCGMAWRGMLCCVTWHDMLRGMVCGMFWYGIWCGILYDMVWYMMHAYMHACTVCKQRKPLEEIIDNRNPDSRSQIKCIDKNPLFHPPKMEFHSRANSPMARQESVTISTRICYRIYRLVKNMLHLGRRHNSDSNHWNEISHRILLLISVCEVIGVLVWKYGSFDQ